MTVDDWATMFEKIYGGTNRTRTSAEKTFHFLEEIGEVERELRAADRIRQRVIPRRTLEWEDEIADVFSWLMAVFLHIRGRMDRSKSFLLEYQRKTKTSLGAEVAQLPLPRFSELLWMEFGDPNVGLRCHRCLKTRCDMTIAQDLVAIDNRESPPEAYVIPARR